MPSLFENFGAVVAVLSAADVPYAVCGGIAMSIHAHPRATIDIDLLAPPDAVPRLLEARAPLGFVQRRATPTPLASGQVVLHRLTKIVPGDPDVLILDVIEARDGTTARAWDTRVTADWRGYPVSVVSRDGLIGLKRLRGSAQDLVDIALLEGRT